jgi:hypothetical protein
MAHDQGEVLLAEAPNNRQRYFVRYLTAILIDLLVLNLFAEYWQHVFVSSFSVSLLVAALLQVLLQLTLQLEAVVAGLFAGRAGGGWKFARIFSAWLILFGSKFIMLGILDIAFAEDVAFSGPLHGVVAFILLVVTMLAAEELVARIYKSLE